MIIGSSRAKGWSSRSRKNVHNVRVKMIVKTKVTVPFYLRRVEMSQHASKSMFKNHQSTQKLA